MSARKSLNSVELEIRKEYQVPLEVWRRVGP
jgi:hypothetical protein